MALICVTLAVAGCGSSRIASTSATTPPTSLVVSGRTYVPVPLNDITHTGPNSVMINRAEYLAPLPFFDYPKQSIIVAGPMPTLQAWLWTGSELVLLVRPCAAQIPGKPTSC